MNELDLSFVDEVVERIGRGRAALIPLLHALQGHYRYLPQQALRRLCRISDITPADVVGVSTFYGQFRHSPLGRHVIRVCHGTACHIKGAVQITESLRTYLKIPEGKDTDADGLFTVDKVACLGCCTLAPVVQIDEVVYGHLMPDGVGRMLRDFLEQEKAGAARAPAAPPAAAAEMGEIRIGMDSCCMARGSGRVLAAIEQALAETHAPALIKRVGCVGMCHQDPLVEIVTAGRPSALYGRVQPEDARTIVLRHFSPTGLRRKITTAASQVLEKVLTDESWVPVTRYSINTRDEQVDRFLGPQKHLASEHCGVLAPLDLDEYIRRDGFGALKRCVRDLTPEQVIDEITRSQLRGRGGAGYPTGLKWSQVRPRPSPKYIVCNCDEGDPGAFMDRMLLESYPYRIIEGIAIAAYATGANEGYLYIRTEYPLAIHRVREALGRCEQRNLLGENILGSGLNLRLRIMEGAGAFVCGEETALMASIEGRRGMPLLRPPYPAEHGLWGRGTLINNVETYSLVPWIIRNGADAFAEIGTENSKGTKVFALAGKIARGGLVEVPMGLTIKRVVEQIGGGAAAGHKFKAVQIGGPSGGCVPAELDDTPIDYEALTEVGAIMGSGGLVVLDDADCMVDIARYFLEFTQDQSCGKCTFCRVGTRVMLEILQGLCEGRGKEGDIERLEQLAHQVKAASLCGLGATAPNPVLSTIRYFRDEYEAHIAGRCPAGICKALVTYSITDDCIGCTRCAQHCPADAIEAMPYQQHEIDTEKCVRCGTCKNVCPVDAVKVE